MVLFNHATREMTAKIVYYGPGLCGKTTNLMVIFDKLDPKQKGKMLSLATKTDRTLFFDLLPVDIGKVGAFNLKIQLYTVPGQVFYNETRKLVLKGADAVVFVADSQPSMVESNRESFANLLENLEENNLDVNDTPIVIQFNKRDIPGVLPIEALQEELGFEGYPYAEAAAIKGEGVMETFKLVSKITAKHLYARLKGKSEPIERKKPAEAPKPAAAAKAAAPAAAAEPEPAPRPEVNPFADSVPFPDSGPVANDYEKMEEVSLEQLLSEGRERPATMSGSVPVPVPLPDLSDDVEELGAESMMPMEDPVAVAVMDEPAPAADASSGDGRVAELESRLRSLEAQLDVERRQHREQLESLSASLDELSRKSLSSDSCVAARCALPSLPFFSLPPPSAASRTTTSP
jgi:signal recognition particle receptor subunit beta